VDEPGGPIPEGREPKRKRHVGSTDNDMETVMGEADANIDDMNDQEMRTGVEVNNLINEVVTEVNLGEFGGNIMESKMEELDKQHAEEIRDLPRHLLRQGHHQNGPHSIRTIAPALGPSDGE
jgi:hypothetical protein